MKKNATHQKAIFSTFQLKKNKYNSVLGSFESKNEVNPRKNGPVTGGILAILDTAAASPPMSKFGSKGEIAVADC